MARGKLAFKETDVARAIRAATKAGMTIGQVEIRPGGSIVILPTAAPASQGAPPSEEAQLDDELEAWRREHGDG